MLCIPHASLVASEELNRIEVIPHFLVKLVFTLGGQNKMWCGHEPEKAKPISVAISDYIETNIATSVINS